MKLSGKNKKVLEELIEASTRGMSPADRNKKEEEITKIFSQVSSSALKSSYSASADAIIEQITKETLDPKELRKKIAEVNKKSFIAKEKTTVGKSILFQSLFGDVLGKAISAKYAKASPSTVQEAMDFIKSFEKQKKKKKATAETSEEYYDIGIGEGVIQTGGTSQIKKRRTDRLSKMIYADETWEVKATDLLESIIKSTGKYQSRHQANQFGNIHEKLRWIIENCCDKCCDNNLPIPIPIPTRGPGRGPVSVPTTVPARIPVQTGARTRVPAGALTEAQIAAYQRAQVGAQTGIGAISAQRAKTGAPITQSPMLGYDKNKVKMSDIIGEERAKVPVSPSRMEQMRRSAIDAETAIETKVTPQRRSIFSDLRDDLNALKDDVVKATDEIKQGGGGPPKGPSVTPVSGEYIPASSGGLQVSKAIQTVTPSVRTTAAPAIPRPGSLVGGIGGVVGSIAGYLGINQLRDQEFKGKSKEQLKSQANQLAEQAKQNNLSKKEVEDLNKQVSAQKKDIANRGAALVGSYGIGAAAAKFTPKFWTGFLKFLAVRSPTLYAKFGARIAASAAGLSIPGPGWLWSAINVLGAAWAAYEIWGLIEEYNALPEEQKVQFEKETPPPTVATPPAPTAQTKLPAAVQKEMYYDIDKRKATSEIPSDVLGLPGSQMSNGYDLDTRKPAAGIPSDVLGLPGSQMSRDTNVIDRGRDRSYEGNISGFTSAAYKDEISAEEARLIKQGMSKSMSRRVAEMNVRGKVIQGELPLKNESTQASSGINAIDRISAAPSAAPQITAVNPPPEKGFFGKTYDTISSAASSAFSSVKSFLGFDTSAGDLETYVKKADSNVDLAGLNPRMKERLSGLAKEYYEKTGQKLQINSGYRSPEKQAELYARFGPPRAAPPGRSKHESGLAVDINSSDANRAAQLGLMAKYGFTRPVAGESWHVEPTESARGGGSPDNPYSPGKPVVVASKTDKPVLPKSGDRPPGQLLAETNKPGSSGTASGRMAAARERHNIRMASSTQSSGAMSTGGSSSYAGAFADGGSIPDGKFGMVGENGPELVTGPANVLNAEQIRKAVEMGGLPHGLKISDDGIGWDSSGPFGKVMLAYETKSRNDKAFQKKIQQALKNSPTGNLSPYEILAFALETVEGQRWAAENDFGIDISESMNKGPNKEIRSYFNQILKQMDKEAFAGAFADGGIIPKGKFGLVGEKGPELLVKQDLLGQAAVQQSNELAANQINAQAAPVAAPVIVNAGGGQKPASPVPPSQPAPKASPYPNENAFNRAMSRDFAHPTAFTSVGLV